MNSAVLFEPVRSLVFGVDVTWRRPMATKQQYDVCISSSGCRSIWTPVNVSDIFPHLEPYSHRIISSFKQHTDVTDIAKMMQCESR